MPRWLSLFILNTSTPPFPAQKLLPRRSLSIVPEECNVRIVASKVKSEQFSLFLFFFSLILRLILRINSVWTLANSNLVHKYLWLSK